MNSLKRKKSFYFIATMGCGGFAGLFLVKILKHLNTASITEVAIVFLSIVCASICIDLFSEVDKESKSQSR